MIQKAISIEEISRKLKPLLGSKVDDLYLQYSIADSLDEKKEIEAILKALYNKNLDELLSKEILLEPPAQEQVAGDLTIGKVTYADKELHDFKLRNEDFPRHVCISGMSGSGKTTLALNMIEQLIEQNKPFMVFDWKKSFRPLMKKDNDVAVFSIGNEVIGNFFKTNINQPPKNVTPKEWITVLTDLISESFSVSYGVHKVLMEALDHAYEVNGVYDGSENYPTWKQLKAYLEHKTEKARGRESQWIESALRIATVLTFGAFGKIVNAKKSKGIEIEDLLNKKVIFELNSLGNIEKKFFCEFILTYIFKMKKAHDDTSSKTFDHAIIVDEAHNIFLKDRPSFLKESVTDMIYREMREYGTSLICLDQHISKLSDTVKGNSACHIAFQQQLPQDLVDISELMQMRQDKDAFAQLPVGNAIVKLSERYTHPFLVKVPYTERDKGITDMEVKERIEALMTGKVPESKSLVESVLELPQEEFSEPITELKPIELPKSLLTKAQEILADYAETKMSQGSELKEINSVMESHPNKDLYSKEDISKAINFAIERKMAELNQEKIEKEIVETQAKETKEEITKEEVKAELAKRKDEVKEIQAKDAIAQIEDLTSEQEKFLRFLEANPTHDLTTVAVYKEVGLSARKGNVVKNELLERKLIKIQEEKNDKGWKKLIRINIHTSPKLNKSNQTQTPSQ
ncbi:MAG: hypothetical protein CMB80_05350 [Flammeovirgaceae bacterium]|nr:hypothetical protein [Flammeovirgaceae bacterium]